MTHSEIVIDNRTVRLGHRIGKGGEGSVFLVGEDGRYAVKLYTASDMVVKEQKVAAMVRAQLASRTSLVAFPMSIARSPRGSFVGFVMKLVTAHKPLHDIYAPGSRKQHFPQADYRFLVRTAANFARAVASVHQANCVIGDINHSGILVSPKATVALIDADSFQFSESGKQYLCRVGVPEYTPPELQGRSLDGVTRTRNHDAFGLAVVIFQLLFMGRHPFVGTIRQGETPPTHENIEHFRYVYSENRDVGMDQPPGTPSLPDFHPEIAGLFECAFSPQSAQQRPSAEDWVKHLDSLEASLEKCQDNPLHFIPRVASECAWCDMENRFGTALFLPQIPQGILQTDGFDPGRGNFAFDAICARIATITGKLTQAPVPGGIKSGQTVPSGAAVEARKPPSNTGSYIVIGLAVAGVFVLPALFLLWAIIGWLGFSAIERAPRINRRQFEQAYIDANAAWQSALIDWRRRIGYEEYHSLVGELASAIPQYKALAGESSALIARYKANRHQKQLEVFLEKFGIQHQSIKGIGSAKQATLASYGIDTAADITLEKLLGVPGFGPVNSRGLIEWRARLEKRFVYDEKPNDTDRQEMARIFSVMEGKATRLRSKLSAGVSNLELLARRIGNAITVGDPGLRGCYVRREQAYRDLDYLGIAIPVVPVPASQARTTTTVSQSSRKVYPGPQSMPSSTPGPKCPRCSSTMVRRMARRGSRAGKMFWGCPRYPTCKGTRN